MPIYVSLKFFLSILFFSNLSRIKSSLSPLPPSWKITWVLQSQLSPSTGPDLTYKETKLHDYHTYAEGLGRSHRGSLTVGPKSMSSHELRSGQPLLASPIITPWLTQSLLNGDGGGVRRGRGGWDACGDRNWEERTEGKIQSICKIKENVIWIKKERKITWVKTGSTNEMFSQISAMQKVLYKHSFTYQVIPLTNIWVPTLIKHHVRFFGYISEESRDSCSLSVYCTDGRIKNQHNKPVNFPMLNNWLF